LGGLCPISFLYPPCVCLVLPKKTGENKANTRRNPKEEKKPKRKKQIGTAALLNPERKNIFQSLWPHSEFPASEAHICTVDCGFGRAPAAKVWIWGMIFI